MKEVVMKRSARSDESSFACLSGEARPLLFEVVESTFLICDEQEFISWVQTELQRILPHEGMMCGIGSIGTDGVHIRHLVGHNVPQEYLRALQHKDGQISSPVLRRWIRERQPVLFDPDTSMGGETVETGWLENLQRFGMRNMAAHGQNEIDGRSGSYFSFTGIPGRLTSHHAHLLKLLVPHMHNTLVRICSEPTAINSKASPQAIQLTAREKEILGWMITGKTNWDIGHELKISEATVKNHVHNILGRLKVRTRTEAVAKAMELKLIANKFQLLMIANAGVVLQAMEFITGEFIGVV